MSKTFDDLGFVPKPSPRKARAKKKVGSQYVWQWLAAIAIFLAWRRDEETTLDAITAAIAEQRPDAEIKVGKNNFIGVALGFGVGGTKERPTGPDLHVRLGKVVRSADNAAKLLECLERQDPRAGDKLAETLGLKSREALLDFIRELRTAEQRASDEIDVRDGSLKRPSPSANVEIVGGPAGATESVPLKADSDQNDTSDIESLLDEVRDAEPSGNSQPAPPYKTPTDEEMMAELLAESANELVA